MTDSRDPIAQALEDLRKKEAAERVELRVPEGMELILIDTVPLMPQWPPAPGLKPEEVLQEILDSYEVDFEHDIDNPVDSLVTICPTQEVTECRFALLKVTEPLGVDVVLERANSFGSPVNIAGLVAVAGKVGNGIVNNHMLLGFGTQSKDGFFLEISATADEPYATIHISHYHKFFREDEPDDEKVEPSYFIPVIIPKNATILPT